VVVLLCCLHYLRFFVFIDDSWARCIFEEFSEGVDADFVEGYEILVESNEANEVNEASYISR
jgi:hypothetical protein